MKTLVLFSFTLIVLVGCGDSKPLSPAERFNSTQNDTNTPYGNVLDNSAVDNPDGTITFETDNGDKLTVPVQKTTAGVRYGTPTRESKEEITR